MSEVETFARTKLAIVAVDATVGLDVCVEVMYQGKALRTLWTLQGSSWRLLKILSKDETILYWHSAIAYFNYCLETEMHTC